MRIKPTHKPTDPSKPSIESVTADVMKKSKAARGKQPEPIPSPTLTSVAAKADKLGASYSELSAEIAPRVKAIDELKSTIKHIAEDLGQTDQKRRTVKGNVYEIGYTEADGGLSYDINKASELPPELFKKITKLERVFNMEALEKAIVAKEITPKQLESFIHKNPPTKKIYVKRIKNDLPAEA